MFLPLIQYLQEPNKSLVATNADSRKTFFIDLRNPSHIGSKWGDYNLNFAKH